MTLHGGYSPGDAIFSRLDWSGRDDGRCVRAGDAGEVLGPSTSESFDLSVKFEGAQSVNMAASEICLAGGFSPGNTVHSKISWKGSNGDKRSVNVGDMGTVLGPSAILARDLLVQFPHASQLNVSAYEISLAGGYSPGNMAFSKIAWSGSKKDQRSVQVGEKGEVLGPATSADSDLVMKFPNADTLNVKIDEIRLLGGFAPGDIIYSKIKWIGKRPDKRRVIFGEKGKVLGPASLLERDLLVSFPGAATLNVDIHEISLAGGYTPGDVAFSKIAWSGSRKDKRRVQVGDQGEVLGPATQPGFDLLMKFPAAATLNVTTQEISAACDDEVDKVISSQTCESQTNRIAEVSAAHVEVPEVTLPGGYSIGEVAFSKIAWSGLKTDKRCVQVGDRGEVLGPATKPGFDLLMKFTNAATLNVKAKEIRRWKPEVDQVAKLTQRLSKMAVSEFPEYMDPKQIRFCQDSISQRFQGGISIRSTLRQLQEGLLTVMDIPHIHVFRWKGEIFSADNRRLWVFKQFGESIPVQWKTLASIDPLKLSNTSDGSSVQLR